MADKSSNARTPAKAVVSSSTPRSGTASTGKQQSILGFFSKTPVAKTKTTTTPTTATLRAAPRNDDYDDNHLLPSSSPCLRETKANARALLRAGGPGGKMTPVPSSDPVDPTGAQENRNTHDEDCSSAVKAMARTSMVPNSSSPTRKTKRVVNYAESSDDDEDVFVSLSKASQGRRRGRMRTVTDDDDDDDEYKSDKEAAVADEDEEMGDFVVSDESDDAPSRSRKRKRPAKSLAVGAAAPRKRPTPSPTPIKREVKKGEDDEEDLMEFDDALFDELPASATAASTSTAQKWRFDPDNMASSAAGDGTGSIRPPPPRNSSGGKAAKEKAHTREPEERYTWLANMTDMDRHKPGDPAFDKSTIYIPPNAWNKFSPFEKQYWEIKQKLWDTIVFFKKGKFYELYENDATVGHQLFDLKLTDRVNMRMVGVPESSLDMWANQFVAKGYKVARVDQMESALAKEMRERGGAGGAVAKSKQDKIIRRELACVLTRGTLVEGSMLQDDMATYCAAIKQGVAVDEGGGSRPVFGIAFVDAATGQFFLSEFTDDVELTKFETFMAQTQPQELLLEKSHVSSKALRILKNNTSPMTLWNYLKAGTEFWDAEQTQRELDHGGYFGAEGEEAEALHGWPAELQEARDRKPFALSALGGLVYYLRSLRLERNLLSQANFAWYDPIHRNGTLVLDGQTLINLEIFANTVDGGPAGTLFQLLNRCITPFGKRLFRQWVCHPLCSPDKINERLDAVDMLNADRSLRDQFSAEMSKMPDLERLGSRIHAGACKPEDFVRALEGFEHVEYTMGLLGARVDGGGGGGGQGLVERLVAAMPDLRAPLDFWKTAFDRRRAREDKVLIPARGIEPDFDACADEVERIKGELAALLERQRTQLRCRTLRFTDVGKEIYQVEAPKGVKVPASWRQMSATSAVKRYYFRELDELVRALQEAEETHSQMVREVAARFFRRFDADADVWQAAVRIVAQLDGLVSLAKASASLGQPCCRPQFVEAERSLLDFTELRHPCMASASAAVTDFIPNDICLGGPGAAKISLLTGANAAGKSTVLRMTCTAVIMAQLGCYVPAAAARLTAVDRIMSRLGANDNIFAAQSTFFVELAETQKILAEATPRSLVILDELGRGTSSYDGVAVAQAVLHHVASHIGCLGFFATHYHSLAAEFAGHPEIQPKRMQIHVDEAERRVTFLYRLEAGVAEGSFGMHCAAMCGIPRRVIEDAEAAARAWEHTSRLKESLEQAKTGCYLPLGVLSDMATLLREGDGVDDGDKNGNKPISERGIDVLLRAIDLL